MISMIDNAELKMGYTLFRCEHLSARIQYYPITLIRYVVLTINIYEQRVLSEIIYKTIRKFVTIFTYY